MEIKYAICENLSQRTTRVFFCFCILDSNKRYCNVIKIDGAQNILNIQSLYIFSMLSIRFEQYLLRKMRIFELLKINQYEKC